MDWACLNRGQDGADDAARLARRTAEAEESKLIAAYEQAVRRAAAGASADAIDALRRVLGHALTNRADISARLSRVKFLALKNLGRLLDERARDGGGGGDDDDGDRDEALRCYARAVELDDEDGVLWGRLGGLAVACGRAATARMAYERAATVCPGNQLFLEALSELCLRAGDFESARAIAGVVVRMDPANARARAMKRAPETLEPTRAVKAARAAAATPERDAEVKIRLGADVEKSWGVIAAVLARLGGLTSPESNEADAEKETEDGAAKEAKEDAAPAPNETPEDDGASTPKQTKEKAPSPAMSPNGDDEEGENDALMASFTPFMRAVEGVDIPRDNMGKKIRFVFDEPQESTRMAAPGESTVVDVRMHDAPTAEDEDTPMTVAAPFSPTQEPECSQHEPSQPNKSSDEASTATEQEEPAKAGRKEKRAAAPVRKSRRQLELDEKKAIEDEKARKIAEHEAELKALEKAAKKAAAEDKKWKPEVNVSRALLTLIGAEDPVVLAVRKATKDVAGAVDRATSLKKKHAREMKEAAAKKAEEERNMKTLRRVSAFVDGVQDVNGGAAHVAWRLLSTTAARWRPDAEDECAPTPSTLLSLYLVFGVGPSDDLATKARVLLCLADSCILAARGCALGQPSRKLFREMAEDVLQSAAIEMDRDVTQDYQAESLFLYHKLAELDGEEPSVSAFYLERAQEVALDDADISSTPRNIEDAAPERFSKQALRAAMDAMKVKEVVTGAASRFAKGQTAELVATLTPLLLPDEDQESTENLDVLSLTQSEKQDALKVLAAAAKKEGSACVVIQLRALKMVYDLTKDHTMLRLMAEAIESANRNHVKQAYTRQALDCVDALGLQGIAASLFEVHYNELAQQPGVVKKSKTSRYGAANMEASAQLISAIQQASKAKDVEVIELHEKLHDRLADCRCCCGEGRKGAFLKSSLIQLANCRNRITKARELRHAAEPAKKRTTKVHVSNRADSDEENDKKKKTPDADEDEGRRRRVRRQRASISSIDDEDRTPQDKADRKLLDRLDKLIVQLSYCVYGFELEKPKRKCREEGGACDSTLKITNEKDAGDLWLSIQPYAMATDEEEREKLSSVIKAIREKIVDPPRTEQSELLTRYLVISEEDVPTASKLGEITEEDRRLARELISQSTPDEQIVSSRQNQATPKKSADATPAQPSTPISCLAGSHLKSAEDKIVSFASVYKTLFHFCTDIDNMALCGFLEEEQTEYDKLFALLQGVVSPDISIGNEPEPTDDDPDGKSIAKRTAELTKLHKFDVEYNMKSPQAWIKLADHLDNIKDIVLNDAAKALSVETYRNSAMFKMVKIVQVSIRRALIAAEEALIMTHYAGHAETEWVRAKIYERLGQTGYELLQDAPPIHDARKYVLDKTSPEFISTLSMTSAAFELAARQDPDNWMNPYFMAKIAKKSRQPLKDVLELHASALEKMPGCLEAIYQVANIRLRMLLSIEASGRKKMTPESQALTLSVLKHPFIVEDMQNSWIGAYRDAVEALLFLHKNHPKFHKANYRLAWSRLKKSPGEIGHCKKALDYLSPLFKVPRTGTFKVCMVEIDDTNLRLRVPATTPRDADGNEKIIYLSGIEESRRRFMANTRRALRLYLSLLYAVEDVGTISSAVSYISDYKLTAKSRFPVIGNSKDIRFFALGLLLRAVASGISQPDVKSAPCEDDVEPHSRESLLELAYNTWFEFAIPARGNTFSWEENVEEAFAQLAVEENRTDSGPDLVKAPYLSAFFFASKLEKDAPSLDFEAYALEHVRVMEQKEDINALAAQLSLCQNRIKEFEADASEHVIEIGTARLKKLVIAHVDAFVRCSNKTIERLASGEIKLQPGVVGEIEEQAAKEKAEEDAKAEGDAKEGAEIVQSPPKQASQINHSEIVLVTTRRLHLAAKQESTQRVNEFIAERRARLTALTENPSPGDLDAPDVPAAAKIHAELRETEIVVERLKKAHGQLVEKALVAESQTTDPEQLKLIREAYDALNAENEKLERLRTESAASVVKYREETTRLAQDMAKNDIANAESTEYLLRVMSAVTGREITDVDEAEREIDISAANLRKEAAELRKKTGRSRKKTAAAADAADAEPAAEPDARDAQQAQDVPEDPPTVTL